MPRHRIWIALVVLAMGIASCKPLPAQQPAPRGLLQHAPDRSVALTSGTTYNPNSALVAPAALGEGPQTVEVKKVVRVGLLLPLTGRNATIGKALQDAATVSLFDKYAGMSVKQQDIRVELLPRDTGDTPQHAQAAAAQAIGEGAQFLIGPLFAEPTAAAAQVAGPKQVSILSFSNNRAHASPGVYMFGFSPQEQARRVVSYAIAHGRTRVAVLVPESPLGEAVLTAAGEAAKAANQPLAAQVKYQAAGSNLEAALNQLIQAGATPNFDALLLPEGGPALGTIIRALASRGVTPSTVQFLGTGMWDDADLLHRVNLTGAWLASSPPELTAQFEDRFRATYNYVPPRIASLSYDAVALAVTLATSDRPFTPDNLNSNAGFTGPANGIFRLRANGEVQRGLAILRINGSALEVVEPPPPGFGF